MNHQKLIFYGQIGVRWPTKEEFCSFNERPYSFVAEKILRALNFLEFFVG